MATKVWHAKEGVIKIDAAGDVASAANTVLDTAFGSGTAIEGQFKDFRITCPVADIDKIDLLGTSSSFQNAEVEEKPAPLAEMSGTIILPGDEMVSSEIFGSGTAAGGTHTTYQPGLAARTQVAVLLNLDDSSDEVNFAIDNAYLTECSFNMTGADGHMEGTVTFKCLPRDFFGPQFKD